MAIFREYITLKEAGEISGYHPDYIGALIRSGKISGKKVGKTWQVSEKEVRAHFMTKHYVPAEQLFFQSKFKLIAVLAFLAAIAYFVIVSFPASTQTAAGTSDDATRRDAKHALTDTVEPKDRDAQIGQ